jgi:DNA-directed RNA polymerase specialized sigma24 family protein
MGLSEHEIERVYGARYRSFRHGAAAIVGDYERAHDVVQEAFARRARGAARLSRRLARGMAVADRRAGGGRRSARTARRSVAGGLLTSG